MTIEITASDVREIVPGLTASDAAINLHISVVGAKVDDCLEANYDDDTAKAIKIYTVAYFADKGNDNKGQVTAQKWADGDSQSYADTSGDNAYWDTVLQLDSYGCVSAAFRSGKVFTITGKSSKYYKCAR